MFLSLPFGLLLSLLFKKSLPGKLYHALDTLMTQVDRSQARRLSMTLSPFISVLELSLPHASEEDTLVL